MRILSFLLAALVSPLSLFAWTPATEQRIAERAVRLAPADLRLLVEKYPSDFRRGIEHAAAEERTRGHRASDLSPTGLRADLEKEIKAAVNAMRTQQPISQFVIHLGRVAHLTGDLNNPFQSPAVTDVLLSNRSDYESYLERRLVKIPTVFYGLDSLRDTRPVMLNAISRSGRFVPLLEREYTKNGERHTSAEFDDRSTAFGVAAICYSRSVTDLVTFYYFIWKEAGGDVRTAVTLRKGNLLVNPTYGN